MGVIKWLLSLCILNISMILPFTYLLVITFLSIYRMKLILLLGLSEKRY